MPVNTGRASTRFKVKVINPNAPDIVRMVHGNIIDNHRKFRNARVNLPPIVSRSAMIVAQERLMPIRIAEE